MTPDQSTAREESAMTSKQSPAVDVEVGDLIVTKSRPHGDEVKRIVPEGSFLLFYGHRNRFLAQAVRYGGFVEVPDPTA